MVRFQLSIKIAREAFRVRGQYLSAGASCGVSQLYATGLQSVMLQNNIPFSASCLGQLPLGILSGGPPAAQLHMQVARLAERCMKQPLLHSSVPFHFGRSRRPLTWNVVRELLIQHRELPTDQRKRQTKGRDAFCLQSLRDLELTRREASY